jgi:PAS domain S-box-containing protein
VQLLGTTFLSGKKMKNCITRATGYKNCVFKNMIDSHKDMVIIWDKNYRYIYVNKTCEAFFNSRGLSSKNRKIHEVFPRHPELCQKWEKRIDNVITSGKVAKYEDSELLFNKEFFSETILFPVFDDLNNVNGALCLSEDIAEKKFNEQALKFNERLSELGKILAYLAHEIRTPLNSIVMNVAILKNNLTLSESGMKSFDIIRQELQRLTNMIREILKFSHYDSSEQSLISLTGVLESVKDLIFPVLAAKNIVLKINIPDTFILGNKKEIQSIFFALIGNSADAIKQNGYINIYANVNEQYKKISIFIEDSGSGIKEPDKIFLPFYTTKKDGTGIGLPTVLKKMIDMNSTIRLVTSNPGCTVFELIFNLVDDYEENTNN